MDSTCRYQLAAGTQVREEDFGLLFYTQAGPRLYFLPSQDWLGCDFFSGRLTLSQWLSRQRAVAGLSDRKAAALGEALLQLRDKGVLVGH